MGAYTYNANKEFELKQIVEFATQLENSQSYVTTWQTIPTLQVSQTNQSYIPCSPIHELQDWLTS